MEVLSRMLRQLPVYNGFSYHPKCGKLHLTHLVFADDLLIFTRGDLPSVKAAASCLDRFATYSGLQANPLKTNVYFAGVSHALRSLITTETGFVEGVFPFKYLGLPLFTSRLKIEMYLPLMEKIRGKINHWANTLLSYAGRVQLINSVLFGLQNFWGTSILLPKGIAKKINKLCKDFLWGIDEGQTRMVFQSWSNFCYPRREGGLDIKEVLSWNKAQIMRWIWKIMHNAHSIWTKWVMCYILKGCDFWHASPKADQSWSWINILKVRDAWVQIFGSITAAKNALSTVKFTAGPLYQMLRPSRPKVYWANTIWDTAILPKHAFIGSLAAQNRLPTVDNLVRRGMYMVNRCALCESDSESVNHLFFRCPFSTVVWSTVLQWLSIRRCSRGLFQVLNWFKKNVRGRAWQKRKRRCALLCAIYELWKERNARIFEGKKTSIATIVFQVQYQTCVRMAYVNNSLFELDLINCS